MRRLLLFAVASLMFAGCNNGFEDGGAAPHKNSELSTLTASFCEAETRTYVEGDRYLRWHEGDLLSVFNGSTLNREYYFLGSTGDNSGEFAPTESSNLGTGNALDRIYAVYPYASTIKFDEVNKAITLSLPATQTYAENSFGKGANTMVATTKGIDDTHLAFKNVGGYLKIKLYGEATIKSLEVRGNNGEKIAGEASITMKSGELPATTMQINATESITLDCGSGVTLGNSAAAATTFWVVVPPTTFSKGITITATDASGAKFEKSTEQSIAISRNVIQPMVAVEYSVASSSEYDVEFKATHINASDEGGTPRNYYVELGNGTWGSNGWGVEGGTYYVFDLYSSISSSLKVPNGTYTLSTTNAAGTVSAEWGYSYTWTTVPFGHPEYLGTYEEATVVVTADGIDAVIKMEDGTTHHVYYEGRPSL